MNMLVLCAVITIWTFTTTPVNGNLNITQSGSNKEGSTSYTLACHITTFNSLATLERKTISIGQCTASGCSASTDPTRYTSTHDAGAIYVSFVDLKADEDGIVWTCKHGSDTSVSFTVIVDTSKSTSDGLEPVDKVGIAIGSVVIVGFIAGAVVALYLNGLLCFATCRRRERQQPVMLERQQPEPEELRHPVIKKAAHARAGSEVQLLPEMASIKNIVSTEWTHAGNKVTIGTDSTLLRIDGTIPWVSPIDSGLWHCKLVLKNANEKKFEIRLHVTVHQYTADEGMRVQLLDYMKKSPTFQSVQWYHKGIKIPDDVHKYQGGSLQVPALYVDKLKEGDAGEYTCKIMLKNTILEIPVKLDVKSTKGNSRLPPLGTPGLNTAQTATS